MAFFERRRWVFCAGFRKNIKHVAVKGDFCEGKWSIVIGIYCADFLAIVSRRASDQDVEVQAGCFRLPPANEECLCLVCDVSR